MQFQYTPYLIPPLATSLVSGWIAFYSWRRRTTRVALLLALLSFAVTDWLVGYTLEIPGTDLPTQFFWVRIQYLGIVTVPLIWLIFAFYYSNLDKFLSLPRLVLLSLIPVVTLFLVFTTQIGGPIWSKVSLIKVSNFWEWHASYGLWFWVHTAYSYLLIIAGSIIIFRSLLQFKGPYRGTSLRSLNRCTRPLDWKHPIFFRANFPSI